MNGLTFGQSTFSSAWIVGNWPLGSMLRHGGPLAGAFVIGAPDLHRGGAFDIGECR